MVLREASSCYRCIDTGRRRAQTHTLQRDASIEPTIGIIKDQNRLAMISQQDQDDDERTNQQLPVNNATGICER